MSSLKRKGNKKIFFGKLILSLFLGVSIALPFPVRAAWEGDAIVAELMHEAWREAYDLTRETILSQLKIESSRVIRQRMQQLLMGTSSQALVIADYEDFIYGSSRRQAALFTRDFFRKINEGISAEARIPLRSAERAILAELYPKTPQVTIDEYVDGGTDNVFDHTKGGGTLAFLAAVENPYNNSFGAYIETKEKVENYMTANQEVQKTKAIAGEGFDTIYEDDRVVPGSLISKLTASAESMPIEIINNASSWPEVISSVATSALQATLKSGIMVVSRRIDDELRQVEQEFRDGLKDITDEIYKKGND